MTPPHSCGRLSAENVLRLVSALALLKRASALLRSACLGVRSTAHFQSHMAIARDVAARDAAIMLPIMLFPNALYLDRLCY